MQRIELSGVPETMLQTLYARAAYTRTEKPLFRDEKAVEIVSQLDYDFSGAKRDAMMSTGVIARTILLDRLVMAFIRKHPGGTVVNIACGLDTRVYRLDDGLVRWINVDLPEVIEVRRRLIPEEGRICMLACSAMDARWAQAVTEEGKGVLVLMEGLVMYLTEADVHQILSVVSGRFERAEVIMETMNPFVVRHMKEASIEATSARFTWGLRSGRELEGMAPGIHWVRDISLCEGMKELYPVYRVLGKIPAVRSISNQLVLLEKRPQEGEK